jgi:hypothetical protein
MLKTCTSCKNCRGCCSSAAFHLLLLVQVVELVAGGRELKVTESNKVEYVNLIARHRMTTSIKAQIKVGRQRLASSTLTC